MIEYTLRYFDSAVNILVTMIEKYYAHGNPRFTGVYGIPQGGIPLAIVLANALKIPLITEFTFGRNVLVVDDLIDSGTTTKEYNQEAIAVLGKKIYSSEYGHPLFYVEKFTDEWIHFWWEPEPDQDPQKLVTRMLEYIGENPNRAGLINTPKRVVKMWGEIFGGIDKKNRPRIQTVPNGEDGVTYDEMLRDTGYFYSCCEHHLIPFFGDYYFGYIPDTTILGASKIGRLVDYYAARPQIAERLVNQVINDIEQEIKPLGSILIMKARHLCKEMRGLRKHNSPYEAIATRGYFRYNRNQCKDEFLARVASD